MTDHCLAEERAATEHVHELSASVMRFEAESLAATAEAREMLAY